MNGFYRVCGILYFLTFVFMGFLGMPQLAGIFETLQHSDILINTPEYSKKYVFIDSINIYQEKGVESGSISGYSKELDNYQTEIELGSYSSAVFGTHRRSPSEVLGDENEKGGYDKHIWYRKGAKYAYVSNEKEHRFPVKSFLKNKLYLLYVIIILLIINRICKVLMKKYKLEEK